MAGPATLRIDILADASKAVASFRDVGTAGTTMGSRLSKVGSAIGGIAKAGVLAAGAAGVGALSTALVKGFSRLNNIEQAEAKLAGLKFTTAEVTTTMDGALAAVKGTAFGLDEAAGAAAQMSAAGMPLKDTAATLTLIGDAATVGGTTMGEMASIFAKVQSQGKLTTEVMNQFGDRGVGALKFVAEELGVTQSRAREMVTEGKVDFATFQRAMENGLGGAAQKSGKTFAGAMANVRAALGRLGASALSGVFGQLPGLLTGLTGQLDKLGPVAEKVGDVLGGWLRTGLRRAGPVLKDMFEAVQPLVPVISQLGKVIGSELIDTVKDLASSATPLLGTFVDGLRPVLAAVTDLAPSIGELARAITGVLTTGLRAAIPALSAFVTGGLSLIGTALDVINPALRLFTSFLETPVGQFTTSVAALGVAFKSLNLAGLATTLAGKASTAFTTLGTKIGDAGTRIGLSMQGMGESMASAGNTIGTQATSIGTKLQRMAPAAARAAQGFVGAVAGFSIGTVVDKMTQDSGVGVQALGALGSAAAGAAAGFAVGGPWGAAIGGAAGLLGNLIPKIFGTSDATADLAAQQQAQARYAEDLKQKTQTLTDAYVASKGAIDANVRATVAKRLEDEGLLGAAQKLGIPLNKVTDAVLRGGPALTKLTDAAWDAAGSNLGLQKAAGQLSAGLGQAARSNNQATAAARRQLAATQSQAQATKELRGQIGQLKGKTVDILAKNLTGAQAKQAQADIDKIRQSDAVKILASDATGPERRKAQRELDGMIDKYLDIYAKDATEPERKKAERNLRQITDKQVAIFAQDKTGPGVSSGKANLNTVPSTKNTNITATDNTQAGVSAAKGWIDTLPRDVQVNIRGVWTGDRTPPGVGTRGTSALLPPAASLLRDMTGPAGLARATGGGAGGSAASAARRSGQAIGQQLGAGVADGIARSGRQIRQAWQNASRNWVRDIMAGGTAATNAWQRVTDAGQRLSKQAAATYASSLNWIRRTAGPTWNELSRAVQKATSSVTTWQERVRTATDNLKAYRAEISQTVRAFGSLTSAAPEVSTAYARLETRIGGLDTRLERANQAVEAQQRRVDAASKAVDAHRQKIENATRAVQNQRAKIEAANQAVAQSRQNLDAARKAQDDYRRSIAATAQTYASVTAAVEADDPRGFVAAMIDRSNAVLKFTNLLRTLRRQGLNETSLQEIIDAGPEAGLATAQAITAGGQQAIGAVNRLQQQLTSRTGALGQIGATLKVMTDPITAAAAELGKAQRAVIPLTNQLRPLQNAVTRLRNGLGPLTTRLANTRKAMAPLNGAARRLQTSLDALQATLARTSQTPTTNDWIKGMRERANAAAAFGRQLRQLDRKGLNAATLRDLLEAGPEQGLAAARALNQGGQAAIRQANQLQAQLNRTAQRIGTWGAEEFYRQGVSEAKEKLRGFRSQQTNAERDARNFARGMLRAIRQAWRGQTPTLTVRVRATGATGLLQAGSTRAAPAAAGLNRLATPTQFAAPLASPIMPPVPTARTSDTDPVTRAELRRLLEAVGDVRIEFHGLVTDQDAVAREIERVLTARSRRIAGVIR